MAKETSDPTRIIGDPTKEFFIFMLTKDIDLTRAIADLVDNSIDGARQLRGDKTYKGLHVDVVADEKNLKFKIIAAVCRLPSLENMRSVLVVQKMRLNLLIQLDNLASA